MRTIEFVDAIGDLVMPRECVGCGAPRHRLCDACVRAAADLTIHRPTPPPPGFPLCVSFGEYAGSLRLAIIAVKERGRRDLVVPLAGLLADAVEAVRPPVTAHDRRVFVVPIPSTPAAARARGGDHMLRIARALRRTPGLEAPPVAQMLRPPKKSVDAVGLSRLERVATRSQAFGVRRGAWPLVQGAHLILVDDLVTSGATLAAAAGVLRAAGAASVRAATIAATARSSGAS